ncbi:MAG: hypothetical protein MZV65_34905 [Chromatiales bacterium]|nr:hypothetical protein [Chromatiales bacterium]
MRICSGRYTQGHEAASTCASARTIQVANAITFHGRRPQQRRGGLAGDIIGLHNHGTIQIGDTFTEGETLKFERHPELRPGTVPPRGVAAIRCA